MLVTDVEHGKRLINTDYLAAVEPLRHWPSHTTGPRRHVENPFASLQNEHLSQFLGKISANPGNAAIKLGRVLRIMETSFVRMSVAITMPMFVSVAMLMVVSAIVTVAMLVVMSVLIPVVVSAIVCVRIVFVTVIMNVRMAVAMLVTMLVLVIVFLVIMLVVVFMFFAHRFIVPSRQFDCARLNTRGDAKSSNQSKVVYLASYPIKPVSFKAIN
jgi:hypothetical protein